MNRTGIILATALGACNALTAYQRLTGATVLAVLNTLVGLNSLRRSGKTTAFVWNMFIITAGTLLPPVWAKFFSVGLATWPYIAVFLWLGIFAFESTGFFASITWFALGDKEAKA